MSLAYTMRVFVAGHDGLTVATMDVSHELEAGLDILSDAGMLNQERVDMLILAEKTDRNPEHFARHLVRLRNAIR